MTHVHLITSFQSFHPFSFFCFPIIASSYKDVNLIFYIFFAKEKDKALYFALSEPFIYHLVVETVPLMHKLLYVPSELQPHHQRVLILQKSINQPV